MTYVIAAISNGGGAPDQAYRKMKDAVTLSSDKTLAGKKNAIYISLHNGDHSTIQAFFLNFCACLTISFTFVLTLLCPFFSFFQTCISSKYLL